MKPKNYRLTKVQCCYTCKFGRNQLWDRTCCSKNYSWRNYNDDKNQPMKMHYLVSPIGKCNFYAQKNINLHKVVEFMDDSETSATFIG